MRNSNKFKQMFSINIANYLHRHWAEPQLLGWALWPFSFLFRGISALRKIIYKKTAFHAKVPVIIVGNLTVGGTGKTPLVIYLAQLLQQHGYKVGIAAHGYKSNIQRPLRLTVNIDPALVGDEAAMLARNLKCPIVIAKKRTDAVAMLQDQVDIIICDDGLQHYKLARDIEIALVDGERKFGNGYCLPMGPLRELPSRLQSVDFVLEHGKDLHLISDPLLQGNGATIHAVAGIGNPTRFFNLLRQSGFKVLEHAFPDHHRFKARDLQFPDQYPIYVTEKDAVKCQHLRYDLKVVRVKAQVDPEFTNRLLALLKEKLDARSELA